MGTYLMMLYVSLEQEVALKDFFVDKGWPYRKPDLATITEHVGPLTVEAVPHDLSTPIPTSLLEKDTTKRKRTPAKNKSPIAKKAKNVRTSLRNPIMKLVTITAKTDEEFKQLTTGMPDSAEVGEVTETFIEENVQDGEEEAVDIKIEPEDPDYDQAEDMTDMENDGDEINDTKNDFDVSKRDGILEKDVFAEYTGEGTSGMGEDDEAFLTSLKEEAKKPMDDSLQISDGVQSVMEKNIKYVCIKEEYDPNGMGYPEEKDVEEMTHNARLFPHVCDQCGKSFKSRTGLLNHDKSIHKQIFKFRCAVCQMGFNGLWNYNGHLARHNTALKEECGTCGAKYQYRKSLLDHIASQHGEQEQEKLVCCRCGQTFLGKAALRHHMNIIHKGQRYLCKFCGKEYKWRSSLLYHHRKCNIPVMTQHKDTELW